MVGVEPLDPCFSQTLLYNPYMEPLKLAGMVLLAISAIEVAAWRILAPRNPNLNRLFPVLMASAVGSAVLGLVLLIMG